MAKGGQKGNRGRKWLNVQVFTDIRIRWTIPDLLGRWWERPRSVYLPIQQVSRSLRHTGHSGAPGAVGARWGASGRVSGLLLVITGAAPATQFSTLMHLCICTYVIQHQFSRCANRSGIWKEDSGQTGTPESGVSWPPSTHTSMRSPPGLDDKQMPQTWCSELSCGTQRHDETNRFAPLGF